MSNERSVFRRHAPSLIVLVAACAGAICGPAWAQPADAKQAASASPWEFSVGLGLARTAEYEGAKRSVSGIAPDFSVSYKTDGWGKISLGGKARGLQWLFVDQEAFSLGLVLQADAGRRSGKEGTLFQPGGKRLKGMGDIKSTPEFGLTGHFLLGAPLYFVLTKGSGDGKPGLASSDFSIKGHGGTRLELGAELPFELTRELTLSVSPNLVWANTSYTQTYFGVTAAQAARSGFKPFTAKGGIKSLGLNVGANYKFDRNWSANAGLSFNQLRGDAALSPVVEKKAQATVAVGVSYQF